MQICSPTPRSHMWHSEQLNVVCECARPLSGRGFTSRARRALVSRWRLRKATNLAPPRWPWPIYTHSWYSWLSAGNLYSVYLFAIWPVTVVYWGRRSLLKHFGQHAEYWPKKGYANLLIWRTNKYILSCQNSQCSVCELLGLVYKTFS